MLKVLLKKQLTEVFRGYFFDARKKRMRSPAAIVGWFLFLFVGVFGILGGTFTMMALGICGALDSLGFGWLYFLLMTGVSVLLGAFGSVFSTYSGLYLAKDNDLLLSLPIPPRIIIVSRLLNVYLMGSLYSLIVLLPTVIVYWAVCGATFARVVCGIVLLLIVTLFVMVLSCLLGWVVAKISVKVKNKSYFTVIFSLLFIGGYYYLYFRATDLIRALVEHAAEYGERIRGGAYVLYLFGRIGEGEWLPTAVFAAATAALLGMVLWLLSRSFLRLASAGDSAGTVRSRERTDRVRTPFGTLLSKELKRFVSSGNYMLNSGIGILLLVIGGVVLLIRGRVLFETLGPVFGGMPDLLPVLLSAGLCMLISAVDLTAPSVSLEGRSLWILQSLPVEAKLVLRAKASVQVLLALPAAVFASACAAAVADTSVPVRLLIVAVSAAMAVFLAAFGTAVGVRMPMLSWTSEVMPIKQSGAVAVAMFGGWGVGILMGALYPLAGWRLGAAVYLGIWTVLLTVGSVLLFRWLDRRGSRLFEELN